MTGAIIFGLIGLILFIYGIIGISKDECGAGGFIGIGAFLIFVSLCFAGIIQL